MLLKQTAIAVDETIKAQNIVNILSVCNKVFTDDGTNIVYRGYAHPGYGTNEARWLIFKTTYNGTVIASDLCADGELDFTKVWDDRATYTYTASGE